ncbi:MAG: MFS transporter [Clostridia bacterium]|nr:MFS transporter [Clostridia bacterium]
MNTTRFKRTKFACYAAYFTMSSIFSLPPLLFVTLREMYGISYTLLGTLVLTNFCTQLTVDLIFTLFSKHFNVHKVVKIMPLITSLGLLIYAIFPMLFPHIAYVGLLIGTVIFSVAAGLSEVLLSPVIAAIPSEHPQRDMSLLHSLYAFGVFTVVIVSTVFFKVFGNASWPYLTMFFAALPVLAAVLFMVSPMPDMAPAENVASVEGTKKRAIGLALCVACIFFGSCAENVMSNWISTYMENALHIDKALGDILGMAMFAILLGIARILYARYGKRICGVLLCGMLCAVACYLIVALSSNAVLALVACILTGFFTSMLWPGSLIMMEEKLPGVGVAAFALMAAGGDLGASVAPQLMGIVVDQVSASSFAPELGARLGLTVEQIGMKAGMLVSAIFPLIGSVLLLFIIRYFKSTGTKQPPADNTTDTISPDTGGHGR